MPSFRADLPASEVHASLLESLAELHRAEQCAVLWFSEVQRRKLYRDLGFGSLQHYAREALGFSDAKVYQFLRLTDALEKLPNLREAMASGEIGWTKARTVASIATPRTEARWVQEAKRSSRRQLEQAVRQIKRRAAGLAQGKGDPIIAVKAGGPDSAGNLFDKSGAGGDTDSAGETALAVEADLVADADLAADVPVSLSMRLTALQRARCEALFEKARKQRRDLADCSRAELLLAALEELVAGPVVDPAVAATDSSEFDGADHPECTRVHSTTPYQVIIYKCDECGKVTVPTAGGERRLSRTEAEAVECDARVLEPGKRNRSTIPPAVRRAVLARDGHLCLVPGCRHVLFLEVNHIVPRAAGGSNRPENLKTTCSSCHKLLHEQKLEVAAWRSRKVRPAEQALVE
jgi:ribosomal protein L44E